MDYLELESIRSEKVRRIPAFRIVRELDGTIEDLRTEALRYLARPINLLARVGAEGDVMQPYLVFSWRSRGWLRTDVCCVRAERRITGR